MRYGMFSLGIIGWGTAAWALGPLVPAFTYDGKAFQPEAWSAMTNEVGLTNSARVTCLRYQSPDRKLLLTVESRAYVDFPVVELRPVLETAGREPTALIEDFQSVTIREQPGVRGVRVRAVTGSKTLLTDFTRRDTVLLDRAGCQGLTLETAEGRSSADWLPYIGVDFGGEDGIELAIGWSGTWRASFGYQKSAFTVQLGMKETHFKLLPGERFAMPSVLVFNRQGLTRREGAVQFHRFLMAHKAPRDAAGKLFPSLLPLTAGGGNKTDEAMLKLIAEKVANTNWVFDTFWVDANWSGAPRDQRQDQNCGMDWFTMTGDWRVNTRIHPDGNLRRVAEAARAAGMKFLLWFEPERVTTNAPLLKTHPDYLLPTSKEQPHPCRYLVNLGNPAARAWVLDTVSEVIRTSGVDIYRQDFNLDPLLNWRVADTPERIGVTEIKYVNGLYAFWDALRGRFNQMLIENCASGGRRMDYELMSRSHSYCRDDAHMKPHPEELCQNITLNSTVYLPFTGGETFKIGLLDDYGFASCIAAGTVFTPSDFKLAIKRDFTAAERAWFDRMIRLADRARPFFRGDFYALTEPAVDSSEIWCAYQCDDPETHAGWVVAFRREKCPQPSLALNLGGIVPDRDYEVETVGGGKRTVRGADFAHEVVSLPAPRSFQWIFYRIK